jgi:hypothetical protein
MPLLSVVVFTYSVSLKHTFQNSFRRLPSITTWIEVEVTLRLTASQSVSLGVEPPSGAHDQMFFTVWHLRSCFCGAPSLTRGRVCLLYTLLALETSLFVAFYDSQGHGGGIRPRLHTGDSAWIAPDVFKITPRHGPHRENTFSQYCCEGVFTKRLPSNGRSVALTDA